MQKKKIQFEDIEKRMMSIAGIRIICQFVEDIYTVVDIIKNRSDMTVKAERIISIIQSQVDTEVIIL